MAKPTVYLETSVIGYATSRPSREPLVAAHQQFTLEWFSSAAARFDLFVSQVVIKEIQSGDETAARERADFIRGLPILAVTSAAGERTRKLIVGGALPQAAAQDAVHIAVAAVHGVEFLVTWNCRHIANAAMRPAIERVCTDCGYQPPIICTPEELMNDESRSD